jgi:hypothetical protein
MGLSRLIGVLDGWMCRFKTINDDKGRKAVPDRIGGSEMPRPDSCVYQALEEEEITLGQLNAGEQFWLKGDIWEVRAPGQNRMTLCKRLGHTDQAMLDSNIIVEPKK